MPVSRRLGKPQGMKNLQNIGVGLFFTVVGMVAAALVEAKRLYIAKAKGGTAGVVPMSALVTSTIHHCWHWKCLDILRPTQSLHN
ncbi:hypothetical protein SLE2022_265610 [Rubroshorea leprosula]